MGSGCRGGGRGSRWRCVVVVGAISPVPFSVTDSGNGASGGAFSMLVWIVSAPVFGPTTIGANVSEIAHDDLGFSVEIVSHGTPLGGAGERRSPG
jgi:hypothetical protein